LAIVDMVDGTAQLVSTIDIPVTGVGAKERVDVLAIRTWIETHRPNHAGVERAQAMPKQGASSGRQGNGCHRGGDCTLRNPANHHRADRLEKIPPTTRQGERSEPPTRAPTLPRRTHSAREEDGSRSRRARPDRTSRNQPHKWRIDVKTAKKNDIGTGENSVPASTEPTAPATVPTSTGNGPTPPDTKLVDPFAHYAMLEGGESFFDGDYVRLDQKTGQYVRGQSKEPIDANEVFVANVHESRHGWIMFGEEGVERQTWLIIERPVLPPCPSCSDTVNNHDDKHCNWKPTVYLPMRSASDADDVVCFTGGGKGARRALAQLCSIYAREGADRRGRSPKITLDSFSFENKSGGKTFWPDFSNIVGWEFFTPGVATPEPKLIAIPTTPPTPAKTAKALPPKHKKDVSGDLDDEIPF
jgi:hypothetical protein